MKTQLQKSLLVYLGLLLFANKLCGIELNFKFYSVENGLSSNTVYAIVQDSKGFVWIGTEDGLNRFDGYEFKIYKNDPKNTSSIRSNYVYCLYQDTDEVLWVGTEKGISTYNPHIDAFIPFDLKANNGISIAGRVENIIPDEKGNIWISVYMQGVFMYDKHKKVLKHYSFNSFVNSGCEPDMVTCIYEDKEKDIWVSVNNTMYQIYKLDKTKDRFVPAFPHLDTQTLLRLSAYSILEDTFGTLWFGTWSNGLYSVDKKNGISGNYLNTENLDKVLHIHSITEYEPGKLLIGSNDGLTAFSVSPTMGNRKEVHLIEPSLSSRFVYPIYKDREGGLWVGTYYGGINYASPNRNYFTSYRHDKYENSVSGNVISSFCEDNYGNLWIGTDDGGLNYFDTKTERFTVYKPDKSRNSISFHNIHGLCADGDKLWIGTYSRGLNVMDVKTKRFETYRSVPLDSTSLDANSIYSVYKDSFGTIWIGTTSGINVYNREKNNFSRLKKINQTTIDILQAGNLIYFATLGKGLFIYDLKTKKWESYSFIPNSDKSLISNDITCLYSDDDGQLWIGTNTGLCLFDYRTKTFKRIPVDFQSNSICNIFGEDGYLWITTTKGLVRFNSKNNQYGLFTQADGLLSDQFTLKSGIKTTNGRIYIGTAYGFNAFYPKQIVTNRYIPPIEVTDFQLFNKSVDLNKYMEIKSDGQRRIVLSHNQNAFSIQYTALSYFASEKNEYAFILEGFDRNWNYVGKQRKATYTNIPHGEYYFKVKASNNDGIWNDTGLVIKIVVEPPFWLTNWALVMYTLVAILLLVLISNYLKKKREKQNNKRIEEIRNEQEKEAYNSKINFFTAIAHEIRTPLSLIIAPLEKIIEKSDKLPDKVVGDLNIIDRNSQRLLFLVNQLLDFRKVEREQIQVSYSVCDVNELLQNICDRFKPFIENKHISFNYWPTDKPFTASIDAENVTKVVSNLLNNASKYTKNYINLILRTDAPNNLFEICVEDNGCGISEDEQENIFKPFYQIIGDNRPGTGLGLYLVKSIVTACCGKISIKSIVGHGTAFSVFFPIIQSESLFTANSIVVNNSGKEIEHQRIDVSEHSANASNDKPFLDIQKPVLLIVEDNNELRLFLFEKLSDRYIILLASGGNEGIDLLEKNEVDIIVSDIMMPDMDGISFCNRVRNNFLWSHIPFILLTAKTNMSSKIEALEIGADAYIEKPFSLSYLSAQIENLLDSRRRLMHKFTETPFVSLKSIAGNKADEEFLSKVNEIIEKNIANVDFTVEQLAEELCISSSGLFAKIRNLSDLTPNKLLLLVRLKRAAELLNANTYRVNEVCYMVGFNSPSYFAKCFYKQFGILPKQISQTSKSD